MFQLLRYFAIACGVTSLLVAIALSIILNAFQLKNIIQDAEQQNILVSRLLVNTIKESLPEYLDTPDVIDPESLSNRLIVKELDNLFHSMTIGLNLLKIKIYSARGLTLYSSEFSQIGEDKKNNPGFKRAANERVAVSKLSFRDEFSAFSGVLFNLDVVETYIPVLSDDGKLEGIFELYTDVTHVRNHIRHEMIWISSAVAAIFILLFCILFIIVLRADRLIKNQYQELERSRILIQQRTEELYIQANYDGLTKLANRVYMYGQLKHDLAFAARHSTKVALLFIDLDEFKNINDTLGHDVGDEVLIVIADRLKECVREYDRFSRPINSDNTSTIARLGGDEFTLIIPDLTKAQNVDILAKKIISECSRPINLDNKELIIGASIGIALYPSDGEEPTTLMRNADISMYQAKQEGRNTFRYFTDEMKKETDNRN